MMKRRSFEGCTPMVQSFSGNFETTFLFTLQLLCVCFFNIVDGWGWEAIFV